MKGAKRAVWLIAALTIILPALAALVSPPADLDIIAPEEFKGAMAVTTLIAWLHMGTAILFLMGLSGFKASLKNAYLLICLGLLGIVVTHIQVPVLLKLSLFESAWFTQGGLNVPYALAAFLMYLGIRLFAKQLSREGGLMRPYVVLPAITILSVVAGLTLGNAERGFHGQLAANMFIVGFSFVNIVLTWRIKRAIGPAYTYAMAWFFIAMAVSLLSNVPPLIYLILDAEESILLTLGSILGGIVFVKAGYAFNKIREY